MTLRSTSPNYAEQWRRITTLDYLNDDADDVHPPDDLGFPDECPFFFYPEATCLTAVFRRWTYDADGSVREPVRFDYALGDDLRQLEAG